LIVSPAQEFRQLIVVYDELRPAGWTKHGLRAVTSRLTPLEHAAKRMAIALAQVLQYGKHGLTEWFDNKHIRDSLFQGRPPPHRVTAPER
jgi:hypothetical protein